MKLGILIDRLILGGAEKVAIQQTRALRNSKQDAYLLVLRREKLEEFPFPDLLNDVPIIYLDDRLPSFLRFSFKIPFFHFFASFHLTYPFLIPWVVKKNEFDYIFSHLTYTSFTAITIKKIRKIRFSSFIWDPIGSIIERVYNDKFPSVIVSLFYNIAKIFDGLIVRNSDKILVGGAAHNDYLESLDNANKIVTLTPSVDPVKILPKTTKDYILLITSWKLGKNPEYVFDLMKHVPNCQIKMAGGWLDPLYQQAFEKQVKELGYAKQISVLGKTSEKELAKLYQHALFFLQMKDDRGFGLPALEAAANGTTFIIPEGQGVCELMKHGKDGFYVKQKDTESIFTYMKRLLSNKQEAITMGKHAWNTVKENYTWDKHAERVLAIAKTYHNK